MPTTPTSAPLASTTPPVNQNSDYSTTPSVAPQGDNNYVKVYNPNVSANGGYNMVRAGDSLGQGWSLVSNSTTNNSTTNNTTGSSSSGTTTGDTTGNNGSTGNTTDQNQTNFTNAQTGLAQTDAEYQNEATNVENTIKGITNGTIPLNAGEQAQVSGLQQQYQTLIDQQKLANTSAQGLGNIRGYQTGAAEYDPTFQVKTIGTIVTAGLNKLADLNTKEASAVANLTTALKNNDIANIKSAWDIYQTATANRQAQFQKTIDESTAAIKNVQDQQEKAREDAMKAVEDAETVRKNKADEANQAAQLAINQADQKIKDETYNATFGTFVGGDGKTTSNIDPSQIPGAIKSSSGVYVIDGGKLPGTELAKRSQIGGIPVISPTNMPSYNDYNQANGLLNKVQAEYNQIKSMSINTADKSNLQTQFNNDSTQLNSLLAAMSTKPEFSTLKGFSIENPNTFMGSISDKGNSNFSTIRDSLNSSVSTIAPGIKTPIFGQVFKSPQEAQTWADNNGYSTELKNLQASYPDLDAQQLLEVINSGQEPK